jgi:hypothetical protein
MLTSAIRCAGGEAHTMLLAEKMALIALRPDTGRPQINSGRLDDCLVGLLAADLALAGRVSVAGGQVAVLQPTPTGDELLDHVLATLMSRATPHRGAADATSPTDRAEPMDFVSYDLSGSLPRPARVLFDRLADDGLATRRFSSVLGFERHAWVPDPEARRQVMEEVRVCGLTPGTPDVRSAILLAQLNEADLARVVFPDARGRAQARARAATVRGQKDLAQNVHLLILSLESAAVAAALVSGPTD